jgi:phage terminase large subunit-like protein
VWEFKRRIDGEDHYYLVTRNYAPQAAIDKEENAHYRGWVNSGHLIDLEQIQEEIITTAETVLIREIAKDPWGGQQMGANLAKEGFEVVDIPQQVRYLSDPMKDIQALVDAGRFHHDDNPCTVWQFSNVEVMPDRNENIFPRKLRAANKIDAAVAAIDAHGRSMVIEPETAGVGVEVW